MLARQVDRAALIAQGIAPPFTVRYVLATIPWSPDDFRGPRVRRYPIVGGNIELGPPAVRGGPELDEHEDASSSRGASRSRWGCSTSARCAAPAGVPACATGDRGGFEGPVRRPAAPYGVSIRSCAINWTITSAA